MARCPDLGLDVEWLSGEAHPVPIQTPIEVELDATYGTGLPDLLDDGILLMSKRMVEGLRAAGVDEIDVYEAILVDPRGGERFGHHLAVQVVRSVSMADLTASDAHDPKGVGHTLVQFRDLVIDERKGRGARMFRLAESASTIVVNDDVKTALEALRLDGVELAPLRST